MKRLGKLTISETQKGIVLEGVGTPIFVASAIDGLFDTLPAMLQSTVLECLQERYEETKAQPPAGVEAFLSDLADFLKKKAAEVEKDMKDTKDQETQQQ